MRFLTISISLLLFACSNSLGVPADEMTIAKQDSVHAISETAITKLSDSISVFKDLRNDSNHSINLVINFIDSVKEFDAFALASISYGKQTIANHIIPFVKGQSTFNIGDTIFSVKKSGRTNSIVIDSSFSTVFKFEKMEILKPHSNAVDVMDWNGEHYVYISEWDGEHRCFVERIWFNSTSKKWITSLVQILSLDIPDSIRGKGNMDWIIDKENGLIYTQTYKDGSSRTAKELVYLRFRLPEVNDGDVTFRVTDIEKKYNRPMIYITQDKKIYKNQMFIASGAPGTKYKRMITVFDLPELTKSREIDLSLIDEEPEGLFFYKDELMMLYKAGIYKIQEKTAIVLNFKDGRTESYALENIKSIDFK